MAVLKKSDFFFHADLGIAGSFCEFVSDGVEDGWVRIKYVPLNSWTGKSVIHEEAVRITEYFSLVPTKKFPGTQEKIMFIFTGQPDSLISEIVGAELLKQNKALREEIATIKKDVMSSKQEAVDAKSGSYKSIKQAQELTKGSRPSSPFGDGGLDGFSRRDPFNGGFE